MTINLQLSTRCQTLGHPSEVSALFCHPRASLCVSDVGFDVLNSGNKHPNTTQMGTNFTTAPSLSLHSSEPKKTEEIATRCCHVISTRQHRVDQDSIHFDLSNVYLKRSSHPCRSLFWLASRRCQVSLHVSTCTANVHHPKKGLTLSKHPSAEPIESATYQNNSKAHFFGFSRTA